MIVRIASLFPEVPKMRTSSNLVSFPMKKRSCASGVEWNVSQGQNDWKRFPCLPRQPLSLATKIPLPTFPVLTNHYLQPSNRFYSAWPSYRSLPRLLLYIPHEGFDKDESLWEGGVGFGEGKGKRGGAPPFSRKDPPLPPIPLLHPSTPSTSPGFRASDRSGRRGHQEANRWPRR